MQNSIKVLVIMYGPSESAATQTKDLFSVTCLKMQLPDPTSPTATAQTRVIAKWVGHCVPHLLLQLTAITDRVATGQLDLNSLTFPDLTTQI